MALATSVALPPGIFESKEMLENINKCLRAFLVPFAPLSEFAQRQLNFEIQNQDLLRDN